MSVDINTEHTDRAVDFSAISDQQLRAKQIDVLYDQLPIAIRATIAAALILVAVLWTVTPLPLLLTWFAVFLLQTSIRLALRHSYRNSTDSPARADYWLRWFLFGVGISGATWGSTILLVVSEGSLLYLGFVSLWVCGLSAGSIASLSVIKGAFITFMLPALLPPALALLSLGGKEEITVGLGLFLFMGFISLNAHRMHKTLVQSLILQFRNKQLVRHLDAERARVEKLNDQLERRVVKRTLALSRINDRLQQSEERLRLALQGARVGLWDWNIQTGETYYSPRWYSMLGFSVGEIESHIHSWKSRIHPDDSKAVLQTLHGYLEGTRRFYETEHRLRTKAGSWLWVYVRGEIVERDKEGYPLRAVGTYEEISRRKQAEEKLKLDAAVFENTSEGVIITDVENRILAVNRAFTEITGYHATEVLGKRPLVLHSGIVAEQGYADILASVSDKGRWQGEIWNRRKNGETYPQWTNISQVKNDYDKISHYVCVFTDITELKDTQKRLEHLAHHDPLTDLPNRLLFSIRLEHALERCRREGGKVAVLFFDLDRFKHVNDNMGHAAGDRLLQQLSQRLLGSVREEDTVARQSGDEFMILLEGLTGGRDAATVAEKALRALSTPFDLEGHVAYITGSVGISLFPDDASTAEMLLKNADTALYRAKHKGRNNFQFFNRQLSVAPAQRQIQETSLRQAIHNEELELYYQPQMDLSTGRVVGAEALVRWRHPHLGLMMPDRFLSVAEGSGLILELDRWVLRKACAQARAWQDAGWAPLRIAANISQRQLLRGELPETLEQVFAETELNPRVLELEFAQGVLLELTEQALDTLNKVNTLGVSLAIDNVGKGGYSSLSHLRRVHFHTVKIDRLYIRNMPKEPDDAATVAKIIDAANRLRLNVVAQGVETSVQREVLHEKGCKQAQGYLYAAPLTAKEFVKYLTI
ncbi:MAG: EAL domain-containing protein [Pseudomonadota bacterium]